MNADTKQDPNVNTKQTDSPIVNDLDMILFETNYIEYIQIEDLSTPQQSENEHAEIESSEDQNEQLNSSIKLLQAFGLPTFENDNLTTQATTHLKEPSYWNALYAIPIMTFAISCTFVYTLIPQHNHVESPGYWYEMAIALPFWSHNILIPPSYILLCYYVLNAEYMVSFRAFFSIYIPVALAHIIPHCVGTLIWTITLGYNPPIPQAASLIFLFIHPALVTSIWIQVSSKFKSSDDRKRIVWLFIAIYYNLILVGSYTIVANTILERFPDTLEWIIAITKLLESSKKIET